ncbi:hypothetical protein SN11_26270 [Vibrio harveyi]|nr:hypothetical protein SN11_26270 [Vibrio harveyi]
MIDVNKGNGFTASQLIAWKNLHEEGIKREHGRQCRRLGWLSKLTIMESPIFKDHSSIELGKVTLIESLHNGTGKTAICEWLSSVSLNNNMGRWIPPKGSDLKFKVSAFVPESKEFLVSSDSNDYSIKVDSVDYPASPIPFRTYFINQDAFKNNLEETEVEHICRILKVEAHTLTKICKRIGSSKYGRVKRVVLKSGEVECTLRDNSISVTFNGLSGGEQSLVIMELIIEKMQFLSESTPSILFIELNELNVQDFTNYFNWLNSTDVNFQTVITSHKGKVLGSKLGIIHYELVGKKPDIEVEEVKI